MSAVVFYYRRSEFTTDSQFTIRSKFSTEGLWEGLPRQSFTVIFKDSPVSRGEVCFSVHFKKYTVFPFFPYFDVEIA